METATRHPPTGAGITVGPLREEDVEQADRIFRLAFGTALGLPEPSRFAEGAELVRTRWLSAPESAFKAELEGEIVGCAFVTRWGSYALMGPLAVRPDLWGTRHAALFTRPEGRNVSLYHTFGFRPRFLTALTAGELEGRGRDSGAGHPLAALPARARVEAIIACSAITDAVYPGLDLRPEIEKVARQGIGDTVVVEDDGIAGFAVCHLGAGSEAGPGACYVKFAAVAPGRQAPRRLERLLDAVEALAAGRGMQRIVAGVNTARAEAYDAVLGRGYRPFAYGVAMHRPDEPAYDRPGAWVLDDGR